MNLDGYVPVHTRLRMALTAHPDLRVWEESHKLVEVGDRLFIEASVLVYRSPDDPYPSRGTVYEPFPGRTAFQRDSELMVAYTSALGRALGYMGFGIERGMASVDEIMARTDDPDEIVTRTKAAPGSRAKRPSEPPREPSDAPPPPDDPEQPKGHRQQPTDKMMAFLRRLNDERGNPLNAPEMGRCAGSFDLCREKIDELQAMPKLS
jgi:hypothetical protein